MTDSNSFTPEPSSIGDRLKELFHEGNVRHVVMKNDIRQLVNLPLNIVLLGTLLAPWLVGIGVVIALVKGYRLELTNPGTQANLGSSPISDSPHGTTAAASGNSPGTPDDNPSASAAEPAEDK